MFGDIEKKEPLGTSFHFPGQSLQLQQPFYLCSLNLHSIQLNFQDWQRKVEGFYGEFSPQPQNIIICQPADIKVL